MLTSDPKDPTAKLCIRFLICLNLTGSAPVLCGLFWWGHSVELTHGVLTWDLLRFSTFSSQTLKSQVKTQQSPAKWHTVWPQEWMKRQLLFNLEDSGSCFLGSFRNFVFENRSLNVFLDTSFLSLQICLFIWCCHSFKCVWGVHVRVYVCHSVHVEVRGQLCAVYARLPCLHGFWGSRSPGFRSRSLLTQTPPLR